MIVYEGVSLLVQCIGVQLGEGLFGSKLLPQPPGGKNLFCGPTFGRSWAVFFGHAGFLGKKSSTPCWEKSYGGMVDITGY